MANTIEKLAPYQFLTAFPQLISRICHAHPEVFSHLKVSSNLIISNYYLQCIQQFHSLLEIKLCTLHNILDIFTAVVFFDSSDKFEHGSKSGDDGHFILKN